MSDKTSALPFHIRPGESLADTYNIPATVLFIAGVASLACTIAAAGYGFSSWVVLGTITTALSFLTSITLFLLEHERLRRIAEYRTADRSRQPQI